MSHSICLQPGRYCVYQHVCDGEIVYVGMGQWYRPFAMESGRTDVWNQTVMASKKFEVVIVAWFDEFDDARQCEVALIGSIKPKCNGTRPPLKAVS